MTPLIHAHLVNGRFGDPALYVDLRFEKRALLFDLGDLHALPPRQVLRVSDVFVSHTHIDHFIGFDHLLRLFIGRDAHLKLYGPAGLADAVAHKLAAFAWNLVDRFVTDLRFTVIEIAAEDEAVAARFRLRNRFRREDAPPPAIRGGVLLDEDALSVAAAVLDHGIPCLAFAVAEKAHVNVWKSRLDALDLPTGPWLRDLRRAVAEGRPDDHSIRIWWREGDEVGERSMRLGTLKREVLRIVPGQKIAYVVDAAFTPDNARRIEVLARNADTLFIEACFAHADAHRAAERAHLTTHQAGLLARRAKVRRLEPFHFSPRYDGDEARMIAEAEAAFRGEDPSIG